MQQARAYFVTGTDTDVGKTYFSCGLLAAAIGHDYTTAAVKPLAAGGRRTAQGLRNEDALALIENCSLPLEYDRLNPVCLEEAIAPHIAAASQNIDLDAKKLAADCRKIIDLGADLTVIEGAGGWLVPLNESETVADIAVALDLPVILVVAMRLGCLNHAMLTADAIRKSGLKLHGWIANQVGEAMPAYRENLKTLKARIPEPLLAELGYRKDFSDTISCADEIDISRFMDQSVIESLI